MSHPGNTLRNDLGCVVRTLSPRIRRMLAVTTALGFVAGFLEALAVGTVGVLVTVMTELDLTGQFPRLAHLVPREMLDSRPTLIIATCILFAVLFLVKAILSLGVSFLQASVRGKLIAELASRLFAEYLRRPYAFHLHRNAADIQTRLAHGVLSAADVFSGMAQVVIEGIALGAVVLLLLYVNVTAAMVAVTLIGVPAYAISRGLRSRLRKTGAHMHKLYRQANEATLHALGGIKELRVLGREAAFHATYEGVLGQHARAWAYYGALQATPRLVLELATVLVLLGLVGVLTVQGEIVAIAPLLGLYAAAAFRVLPAANRIVVSVQGIRHAEAGLHAVAQDLSELEGSAFAVLWAPSAAPLGLKSELHLDKVSFSYGDAQPPVLADIDLTIRAGECAGFVGATGTGKSTLMDVILGILEPTSGRVMADGVDIKHRTRDWQASIGYVPQSIFLLDDTIRANVALGIPPHEVAEEKIWKALEAAQLGAFVSALPGGLEARVGERGVRISGGERQRIAIARALYHDPGVLILDEATSALDHSNEAGLMDAVLDLRGHKTIMIVAHRLTTIERCDRIFLLEKGRVGATQFHESVATPFIAKRVM